MGKLMMRLLTTLHANLVKATGKLGGGSEDGSVLVLEHIGAKSGKQRTTPLMFIHHGEGYAVVASMGGAPTNPGWYHNLVANPDVTVVIDRKSIPVRSRQLEGSDRDSAWERFVEMDPRWERYASGTDRVMPIIALDPLVQPAS